MAGWVGRTLGKVQVELLLARGGVAEVYLGRHATLQRAVAVKVLNTQYADDPELLTRFQREARVVAMLRHPNIVQVHDFDNVDGHPYLIMEYVPGVSLAAHMRALHLAGARMDLETIDRLLRSVAEALQYAHEHGVVHRDVKPANILLTSPSAPVAAGRALPPDFEAVLTDFGLVRFLSSAQQTSTGQIAGTPAYMSPEQAAGSTVNTRTDVYSLGIVLYELLAGRVPFEADSAVTVLQMHIHEQPPPIPNLPIALQAVLDRALQKQPSDRLDSPQALASAYSAARLAQAEAPTEARELVSSTPAQSVQAHANRVRSWLSTALVGVVILALAGIVGVRSLFAPPGTPSAGAPAAGGQDAAASNAPSPGDPIGILRFQDGAASVDEVTFNASGMPLPAAGSQYEVWLISETGEELRSVGYLTLDPDGNGSTSFVDSQGRNLLASYNAVEVTLEPNPDPSPNPAGNVLYITQLPKSGLTHVRHLLVGFPKAPNGAALLDGLLKDTERIDGDAKAMLTSYQSGDEAATRARAESIINLLVGAQSPEHRDWNNDGQIQDLGDGFGLLLNGDSSGYIQGSYSHAQFAATAEDATENMQTHGQHVMVCAGNLAEWAPQLRDLMKQIATAPFDPAMGGLIRQAVALSDNMLLGTDLNGNERVEPLTGEGGAQTAYQHALYMADMVVTLPK